MDKPRMAVANTNGFMGLENDMLESSEDLTHDLPDFLHKFFCHYAVDPTGNQL